MKPRAFVIMPFGARMPVGFGPQEMALACKRKIDFDLVFKELFEPALLQAGYEVVRADSEVAAGDIRTDMFFELVTADLVVADISILNANVFYELGVRHGVCPRGVFIVNGNVMPSRPFDVAPDRSFSYEASCSLNRISRVTNTYRRREYSKRTHLRRDSGAQLRWRGRRSEARSTHICPV